jgi:hypothetical protein
MPKEKPALAGAKNAAILVSLIGMNAIACLLGPSRRGFVNLIGLSVEMTRALFACSIDGETVRKVVAAASGEDPVLLDQSQAAVFCAKSSLVNVSCN